MPEKYVTKKLCTLAINNDYNTLAYVPDYLKTPDLYNLVIDKMNVPFHEFKSKSESYHFIVRNQIVSLGCIPERFRTIELCTMECERNGQMLRYVSYALIAKELCLIAVNKYCSLKYVPIEYRTENICKIAIDRNKESLSYIPKKFKTAEFYKTVIDKWGGGYALQYVPEKFKTFELCMIAINVTTEAIQYVPEEMITMEMCKMVVEKNSCMLNHIPRKYMTIRLYVK